MPKNLLADEKHSKRKKGKVYIATTASEGCVLGAEVCEDASAKSLTKGYKTFADEAKNLDPNYAPKSVNTDGWDATRIAFSSLFIGISIIRCFLHGFIKVRDCCRTSPLFDSISGHIWHIYKADCKKKFSQRVRRLKEWATLHLEQGTALTNILSLCGKSSQYQVAYDHPEGYRTSNMVDRLMRFMDRAIFTRQNFHGTLMSANTSVRSWAILRNYFPYCLRKIKNKKTVFNCPASELNKFTYSSNWLENLVVSSSMNGYRQ